MSGRDSQQQPAAARVRLGLTTKLRRQWLHERLAPSAVDPDTNGLLLQRTETDALNSVRAFLLEIANATKGSHQDPLQSAGAGVPLKYVSTYVPKFSDEFAAEWLGADLSFYYVVRKVSFDYHPQDHPQETDMWLQLAAQQFPVFKMAGTIFLIIAPYPGTPVKPDFVERYAECPWKGEGMSLLEYLRRANQENKPLCYNIIFVEAYKRTLAAGDVVDHCALARREAHRC